MDLFVGHHPVLNVIDAVHTKGWLIIGAIRDDELKPLGIEID
jgi:hypothetical protein